MKTRMMTGVLALGAAAALALTGCSSDPGTGGGDADSKGTVTFGMFNWDEGIAVTNLWKAILEEEGYEVKIETADPAPVYKGVADGDYDAMLDVWLPLTHASYIEQYGDDIVELGAWNDEAKLTIAVNADAPIDSLDELAANADVFGNKLVGIEAGAGLTETTENAVIPGYGLEKMDYVISSTPAMLTELDTAMKNGDDVAVTLWKPHWAYNAYDLKDLEDPKGTLGEAESIYSYGSTELKDKFPEVAQWLTDFKMDSDLLHSLENVMFNEYDGSDYEPIVKKWISENQEYVDSLTA
ncbi:glycine betaine ABC transporter substrate-binding protein [Leucobacter chromiireducens]|uniref:Glycine betaine ABC transporter substrate-binding protein n=1 Tax=Leucobacter chromiireducens subsp. solipictus TaxID=398235 RepID=A0ABS1SG04_9MICO|nr:glycine betaine ABC transporter substrate-binding protein [Leucobacter chromiireducens]MBL3679341.1 glycine betaine ABC transporter substrate-binding protein [Leucobacter chromiireducens subsp. solipictus]